MSNAKSLAPLRTDGTISITISYHLSVGHDPHQRLDAHYVIECPKYRLAWNYQAPPSCDADFYLPLSQLQSPDGYEDDNGWCPR
jgi:hypothetical protein